METIHDQATQFGIERPELDYREYMEGPVTVVALTQESDVAWGNYLRNITLARIAFNQQS